MENTNTKQQNITPPKMKKNSSVRLETSELIFKIVAYVFCGLFALMCIYPFVYAISASLSGKEAYKSGSIILLPKGFQSDAFKAVLFDGAFWSSYANTLFVTFYGTVWSLGISILGGYALSKKRLVFRTGFNFYLLFTMWFTAGLMPQYLNYMNTQKIFNDIGIADERWMIVIAMGMNAFNVILLRNAFEGVPKEIEEAAIVDGATEFSLLWNVYVPMSKSSIATVGLFFGISRWNGYFWASKFMENSVPLQVYIRDQFKEATDGNNTQKFAHITEYAIESMVYAMIVCSIIPIMIIYPYIQKYFATGVNVGGVKE